MPPRQTSAALSIPIEPFVKSTEIELVADRVISDNIAFRSLQEIELVYLLNNKPADATDLSDGIDSIVRAVKAPPIWRFLSDTHVAIWVVAAYWRIFDETQRRAIVTHALSHVSIDETDEGDVKVKIVGHDVEEFHRVAVQFGAWTTGVATFAKALTSHRDDGQAVQTAVETAVQQLDGQELVVGDTKATVSVRPRQKAIEQEDRESPGETTRPEDPDATLTDDEQTIETCGTPIADGVVCQLAPFHDGPHEGPAPVADETPAVAPAKRSHKAKPR
jgi:hypothetical protein